MTGDASSETGMKQFTARMIIYMFLSLNGFVMGAAYITVKRGDLETILAGTWEIPAADLVMLGVLGVLFVPFTLAFWSVNEP